MAIEAHLQTTSKCYPGTQALYTYSVTVKNVGPVAYDPQTGNRYQGLAVIMEDQHFAPWPMPTLPENIIPIQQHGWSWSVGGTIRGILPPGATSKVLVSIPYYTADPAHMTKYPVHPFQVSVLNDTGPVTGFVYNRTGLTVDVPAPIGCP